MAVPAMPEHGRDAHGTSQKHRSSTSNVADFCRSSTRFDGARQALQRLNSHLTSNRGELLKELVEGWLAQGETLRRWHRRASINQGAERRSAPTRLSAFVSLKKT